jgi:hypothetical protein
MAVRKNLDYAKSLIFGREVRVVITGIGATIFMGGKTVHGGGGYAVVELSWRMLDRMMKARAKEEARQTVKRPALTVISQRGEIKEFRRR